MTRIVMVTINFSGNVGKTMLARHLIAPRINGVVIPIESINADEQERDAIKGHQYGKLQDAMWAVDAAVVDVGASNVENFTRLMKQYQGSHEIFDYFVVPAVATEKQLHDTIATINYLSGIGIPPEKILVVFNRITSETDMSFDFAPLRAYYEDQGTFTLVEDAQIAENELYQRLQENGINTAIADLADDQTDYKKKLTEAKTQAARMKAGHQYGTMCLARGVRAEHDHVFNAMFPSTKTDQPEVNA